MARRRDRPVSQPASGRPGHVLSHLRADGRHLPRGRRRAARDQERRGDLHAVLDRRAPARGRLPAGDATRGHRVGGRPRGGASLELGARHRTDLHRARPDARDPSSHERREHRGAPQ